MIEFVVDIVFFMCIGGLFMGMLATAELVYTLLDRLVKHTYHKKKSAPNGATFKGAKRKISQ